MENQDYIHQDEISIKEIILTAKKWINFLVKRWVFVGIACFLGVTISLFVHFLSQLTTKQNWYLSPVREKMAEDYLN
jgi:hypothetical protein